MKTLKIEYLEAKITYDTAKQCVLHELHKSYSPEAIQNAYETNNKMLAAKIENLESKIEKKYNVSDKLKITYKKGEKLIIETLKTLIYISQEAEAEKLTRLLTTLTNNRFSMARNYEKLLSTSLQMEDRENVHQHKKNNSRN